MMYNTSSYICFYGIPQVLQFFFTVSCKIAVVSGSKLMIINYYIIGQIYIYKIFFLKVACKMGVFIFVIVYSKV